jgi:5-methylcytosine-specific restriction endonuclease McrA
MSDRTGSSASYKQREAGYRDKALKMYPWVCGRCAREFTYSNLSQLTVHHIDHNHDNNPADGSNWELLCLYCHDHEHSKYSIYNGENGSAVIPGEKSPQVKHNPFANLKALMDQQKD